MSGIAQSLTKGALLQKRISRTSSLSDLLSKFPALHSKKRIILVILGAWSQLNFWEESSIPDSNAKGACRGLKCHFLMPFCPAIFQVDTKSNYECHGFLRMSGTPGLNNVNLRYEGQHTVNPRALRDWLPCGIPKHHIKICAKTSYISSYLRAARELSALVV